MVTEPSFRFAQSAAYVPRYLGSAWANGGRMRRNRTSNASGSTGLWGIIPRLEDCLPSVARLLQDGHPLDRSRHAGNILEFGSVRPRGNVHQVPGELGSDGCARVLPRLRPLLNLRD